MLDKLKRKQHKRGSWEELVKAMGFPVEWARRAKRIASEVEDPLKFPSVTKAYDSVRTSSTSPNTTEDLKKQLKKQQDIVAALRQHHRGSEVPGSTEAERP